MLIASVAYSVLTLVTVLARQVELKGILLMLVVLTLLMFVGDILMVILLCEVLVGMYGFPIVEFFVWV